MPFIDNGFVHCSRKAKPKKRELKQDDSESSLDPSMKLVIKEYRQKIRDHMRKREYSELEQVLQYLTTKSDQSMYARMLYNCLRMDIIHGQICMSKYTQWKQD